MAWRLPGFVELGQLGAGAGGRVVSARHQGTGTVVAVKYLSDGLRRAPGAVEHIRAAVGVLVEMDHPNIVHIYEYAEAVHGAAIVMELVDGVSLAELIGHQGATEPEAALYLLRDLLSGLAATHERGVTHGGIRPANVLIDASATSKLVDFATRSPGQVPAEALAFQAPELAGGAPPSMRSDMYAATATLVACLTGRPLHSFVPPAIGIPEGIPATIPDPVRDLIVRGLAADPDGRPDDATAFLTELEWAASDAYGVGWAEVGKSKLVRNVAAALILISEAPANAGFAQTATRYVGGPIATKVLIGAGIALVVLVGADTALGGQDNATIAAADVPSFTLTLPTAPPVVAPAPTGAPQPGGTGKATPTTAPTQAPAPHPTLIGLDPTTPPPVAPHPTKTPPPPKTPKPTKTPTKKPTSGPTTVPPVTVTPTQPTHTATPTPTVTPTVTPTPTPTVTPTGPPTSQPPSPPDNTPDAVTPGSVTSDAVSSGAASSEAVSSGAVTFTLAAPAHALVFQLNGVYRAV